MVLPTKEDQSANRNNSSSDNTEKEKVGGDPSGDHTATGNYHSPQPQNETGADDSLQSPVPDSRDTNMFSPETFRIFEGNTAPNTPVLEPGGEPEVPFGTQAALDAALLKAQEIMLEGATKSLIQQFETVAKEPKVPKSALKQPSPKRASASLPPRRVSLPREGSRSPRRPPILPLGSHGGSSTDSTDPRRQRERTKQREEIDAWKNRAMQLESEMNKRGEEIQTMQQHMTHFHETVQREAVESWRFHEANNEVNSLKEQLHKEMTTLQLYKNHMEISMQKQHSTEQQRIGLHEHCQKLETTVADVVRCNELLTQQLDQITESARQLEQSNMFIYASANNCQKVAQIEMETIKQELEQEQRISQRQRDRVFDQEASWDTQAKSYESKIAELQKAGRDLQQNENALRNQVSALQKGTEELEGLRNKINAVTQLRTAENETKDKQIMELQASLSQARLGTGANYQEVTNAIAGVTEKYQKMKREYDKAESKCVELQEKLSEENRMSTSSIKQFKREIRDLEEALEMEHKAAKLRSRTADEQLTSEQQQQYERTIERQVEGRKKLEEEIKSLRETNDELTIESEQKSQKLETLLQDVEWWEWYGSSEADEFYDCYWGEEGQEEEQEEGGDNTADDPKGGTANNNSTSNDKDQSGNNTATPGGNNTAKGVDLLNGGPPNNWPIPMWQPDKLKDYTPLRFPKKPDAVTIPDYLAEVFSKLNRITKYTDKFEREWLYTVVLLPVGPEHAKASLKLLENVQYVKTKEGKEYDHPDLDRCTRLDNAIGGVVHTYDGALKRRQQELEKEMWAEDQTSMTSRQLFYLLFEHLAVSDIIIKNYNLATLRTFEWLGDHEGKMRKWLSIALMMSKCVRSVTEEKQAEFELEDKFSKNMLNSADRFIVQDMALYVRERKYNKELYNSTWLLNRVRGRLDMFEDARKDDQIAGAYNKLMAGAKGWGGYPAGPAAIDKGNNKGKGKDSKGKGKGKESKGKGKGKDKGKGKGKDKGKNKGNWQQKWPQQQNQWQQTSWKTGGWTQDKWQNKNRSQSSPPGWRDQVVQKKKAVPGTDAAEKYGLTSGYLACHHYQFDACQMHSNQCYFTHEKLSKERIAKLPRSPSKNGRSASKGKGKDGKSRSQSKGGKGKDGKGKDKGKGKGKGKDSKGKSKDKGKGKAKGQYQWPDACPEFLKKGNCTWAAMHNGQKCRHTLHLNQQQHKAEFARQNPGTPYPL